MTIQNMDLKESKAQRKWHLKSHLELLLLGNTDSLSQVKEFKLLRLHLRHKRKLRNIKIINKTDFHFGK